ncbi:MAG: Gfo/Idh/MocA family oxidoreductase [Planctomycetota bacterium]|jgi:predicted dehydrogenase
MFKLGIIGMNKDNGHPFSWSAIVNGYYDEKYMHGNCHPCIPVYLNANRDTLGIDGVKVTHVWTQERKISENIAAGSKVDNIVDNLEDLIGQVEGVLLARDDAGNHIAMAKPFLDADVPIFIDKPLAATWADLDYFSKQNQEGKLFMSCSSLRYSSGVQAAREKLDSLGEIGLAVAVGPKDWIRYGVHYLEGLFSVLNDPMVVSVRHISKAGKDIVYIEFENGVLATIHVFMGITAGQLTLYGKSGSLQIDHGGAYGCFKTTIIEAVRSFKEGRSRLDFAKTHNVISTLIAGKESFEKGGETVKLK